MTSKTMKSILYIAFLLLSVSIFAQDIDRNVVVVKPYEPSLSDAYKISNLPRIDDTTTVKPDFNYSILPVRVNTPFELKPINAAKMVGMPLEKLYKSFLRLGAGNHSSFIGEYSLNSLRKKDLSYGAGYFHKSSNAKIELDNKHKVPAGYSSNRFEGYINKYFANTTLAADGYFDRQVLRHYGYNTSLFDTIPQITDVSLRQYYSNVGANFKVYSANQDSDMVNYNLGLGLNYLWDKFENGEGTVAIEGGLSKLFKTTLIGADLKFENFNSKLSSDSISLTLTSINPYFSRKNEEFEFLVGGRVSFSGGEKSKVLVFPRAYLQINVVKNILMPYIGVDGKQVYTSYGNLLNENPYIVPGSRTVLSDNMFFYGGLKGILSSKAGFNLYYTYNVIHNSPFYVNDTTGLLDNRFGVIYDDDVINSISGEIYYDPSESLKFMLKSNFYSHNTGTEEKAWHKPGFDLKFGTMYSFHNKVIVNFDFTAIGKRYAKPYADTLSAIELDPIIDLNLGIEYKYSKVLSVFLNFYNLTSSKYYYWNQYPNQKLNFIAGFSYKI